MKAYLGWSQGTNLALGVKEWHALWPGGGGGGGGEDVDYDGGGVGEDGGGDNDVDVDDGCVIINDFVPREAQYEARGTKQSGTSRSSWPV